MDKIEVRLGSVGSDSDMQAMLKMLDAYMRDPMGGEQALSADVAKNNVAGLRNQPNYIFFLAYCNGELAGIANCFVNFSTFKAKPLLNIHDFAVDPAFRRKGIGVAMMDAIADYGTKNDYCKITLEVRYDNYGAQKLYQKTGFKECNPNYYFWEKLL